MKLIFSNFIKIYFNSSISVVHFKKYNFIVLIFCILKVYSNYDLKRSIKYTYEDNLDIFR